MKELLNFTDPTGKIMQGCKWEIQSPRAVVVIATGMMETSDRYDDFASYLNTLGCSVYCPDHYGQGRNCTDLEGLGIWPINGFQRTIDMLHKLIDEVCIDGLPLFLFAHSMGSYITQGYLQQFGESIDRVVLCGSSGKRSISPIAAKIAAHRAKTHSRDSYRDGVMDKLMFGGYCGRIPNARTPFDWLSANSDNVDRYIADPKCGYVATSGFYAEFLKGLAGLCRAAGLRRIPTSLPIFLISGTDDPSTEYGKGTEKLAKMYESYHLNVHLKLYPGLRHELLNESKAQIIFDDIAEFLLLK